MPSAHVNGRDLEYLEKGTGDPLILVHGSLGDYRDWAFQMEPFSKRYHVVAYSRRSHYPNAWTDYAPDYSLNVERDDLVALIDSLGLGKVHLLGHSYGAYTATLVARDHPTVLRSLVISEPPILALLTNDSSTASLYDEFENNVVEPTKAQFRSGNYEKGVRVFLDGVLGIKDVFDQLAPEDKEITMQNARTLVPEIGISPQRDPFTQEDAARIITPTLLLKGELSPAFLRSIADTLSQYLPNCEMRIIAGASHAMLGTHPEVCNDAILTFLSKR